jgi:hypothetical protein
VWLKTCQEGKPRILPMMDLEMLVWVYLITTTEFLNFCQDWTMHQCTQWWHWKMVLCQWNKWATCNALRTNEFKFYNLGSFTYWISLVHTKFHTFFYCSSSILGTRKVNTDLCDNCVVTLNSVQKCLSLSFSPSSEDLLPQKISLPVQVSMTAALCLMMGSEEVFS